MTHCHCFSPTNKKNQTKKQPPPPVHPHDSTRQRSRTASVQRRGPVCRLHTSKDIRGESAAAALATQSQKSKVFLKSQPNSRNAAAEEAVTHTHAVGRGCEQKRLASQLRARRHRVAAPTAAAAVAAVSRARLRCNHRLCLWSNMCLFKRLCMSTSIDRLVCLLLGDFFQVATAYFRRVWSKCPATTSKLSCLGRGVLGKHL